MRKPIDWTPKMIAIMYLGRKKGWKSSKIVQALFERFPELQTYNEGSIRTYISNIFAKKDPKTAFQEWLQQKGYLKRKKKTISSSTFPKTIRIRTCPKIRQKQCF